jgi:hypothetical protein
VLAAILVVLIVYTYYAQGRKPTVEPLSPVSD